MAQCSHKECLHRFHEEIHSSSLPSSIDHPAERAFKLAGSGPRSSQEVAGTGAPAVGEKLRFGRRRIGLWLDFPPLSPQSETNFHHSRLCLSLTQRQRRHSIAHGQKTSEFTANVVDADALLYILSFLV